MQGQGNSPPDSATIYSAYATRKAHFFLHYSPEDVPYGKKSERPEFLGLGLAVTLTPILEYHEETKRLYGVIEIGLTHRDWLAGPGRGKFSIADANVLPWYVCHAVPF